MTCVGLGYLKEVGSRWIVFGGGGVFRVLDDVVLVLVGGSFLVGSLVSSFLVLVLSLIENRSHRRSIKSYLSG
jgi:hypothetical protein